MPRKRKGADLSRNTSRSRSMRNRRSQRTEEQIQQQNTDARVSMAQLRQEQSEDTRAERNEIIRLQRRQSRCFKVNRRRTNDQQRQQVPLFRYVDVNDIKLFADPLAEDRAEKEKEALPILNRDTECGPPQEKQIKLEPKDVEQDISSGVFIKNEVFINDSFIDSSDTFHQEGLATTSRISYSSETVEETSSGIRIPNGQHGEKDIYSRFGEIVADSLRSLKQDHLQEKLEQLIQHEHLRKKLEQLICKAVVEVSIKD